MLDDLVNVTTFKSQCFPQSVKYLLSILKKYWLRCYISNSNLDDYKVYVDNECVVAKEGFVMYKCDYVVFNLVMIGKSVPEDLEYFCKCQNVPLLSLLLKERWFKGDFGRLLLIMQKPLNVKLALCRFIENCLWERGYEDYYTLGQQLSIRMTTNLIQSGLDFKHHITEENIKTGRGWCEEFEKVVNIQSVADITKRYKCNQTFITLEIDSNNFDYAMELLKANFKNVYLNKHVKNLCLIKTKETSDNAIVKLDNMLKLKLINFLFTTDTESYINVHRIFYIYNSMKFYYYCLKNKFVFEEEDYETLYFIYTIVMLQIINGGCLNTFTLEKSPVMNPLELNSRRCNALKRASLQNKFIQNDVELKVDFIKGKRITAGTHNPDRLVQIDL
uniref:p47 n=1 Tax=Adoxophyes orana granulovirus TaxID=170617 RepID=A0A0A0V9J4_GVAO|nr:p47 [Adoxophyes orana granulovirus]